MTTAIQDAETILGVPTVTPDVYPPQHDSALLIDVLRSTGRVPGNRVADLCTGSGVVGLAAAASGASDVTALDLSADAVRCARSNAAAAGLNVDVHLGSWARAVEFGPFDVVTCNPPYVPYDDGADVVPVAGPSTAWNAGRDGRLVLDPLCENVPSMLADGGTVLIVQSEFAGINATVRALRAAGLRADVVAEQLIPFGPVMSARAEWLEREGLLPHGRREEWIAVIRGYDVR